MIELTDWQVTYFNLVPFGILAFAVAAVAVFVWAERRGWLDS